MLANLRQSNPHVLGLLVRNPPSIVFIGFPLTNIVFQICLDELLNSGDAPALSVRDKLIPYPILLRQFTHGT